MQSSVTEQRRETQSGLGLGLVGRAFLILFLFNRAAQEDLFSFADPGRALVTTTYLASLLVMAGAVVLFWRNSANSERPAQAPAETPVARRIHSLFSEPWYEVPAVLCMVTAGDQFISSLLAQPPQSTKATWYLLALIFAGVIGAIASLRDPGRGVRNTALNQRETPGATSPRTGPLSDPVFRRFLFAFVLVWVASDGVAVLDRESSSVLAWAFLVLGSVLAAIAAAALIQSFRAKQDPTA